jgi:hypothetical protein
MFASCQQSHTGESRYPGPVARVIEHLLPTPESHLKKPWAILGITRKQFAAAKPWMKAGMTKEKYAELLNMIPHEAMQILKDEVDAERLVESIFRSQGK